MVRPGDRGAPAAAAHPFESACDMISTLAEEAPPLVLIVDDDEDVRTAIGELMLSVGIEAVCYGSTRELIESPVLDRASCLVPDVRMPGSSGLDLQQHLATAGIAKPIVFLTGHGDIPMTVQAMKAGAVDFLTKQVRDQTLPENRVGKEGVSRCRSRWWP